jgi:DNA-directed RNA polymerase subunit RPC12/RpoP
MPLRSPPIPEDETCSACNTNRATHIVKQIRVCNTCSLDILIANSHTLIKRIDAITLKRKE